MKRTLCSALPLLGILGFLASCGKGPDSTAASAPQMPPTVVTVAPPMKKKIHDWQEFTGRIEAEKSVRLFSQVTGYLQSIHFKDGAEVKKGDLLFVIDPRPFQAVLDQAKAEFDRAQIKLELAQNEFERGKRLVESRAISAEDFDIRSQAVREAQASVKVAQAAVDVAALNVDYTQIKAPMDGRIGRRLMDIGSLVIGGPMGASELGSILSLDPIYCYVDADELSVLRQSKQVRENPKANGAAAIECELGIATDDGTFPHKGKIDFVDNRLDPSTGTIQTRAVFSNPKPAHGDRVLQPGFFARVKMKASHEYEALLVDDKAVGSDHAIRLVLVVGANNMVEQRVVEVGSVVDGMRVIKSGLKPDERVIVNGQSKVRPGMPVQPMTVAEASKAAAAPPATASAN